MNDQEHKLYNSRFYAAKSEAITSIETVDEAAVGPFRLAIWDVHRPSGRDLYQVLVDEDHTDVLASPGGARAYGEQLAHGHAPGLGQLHLSHPLHLGSSARVVGGEQSNTSLIYLSPEQSYIVKVFRRLEPGISPDVELLSIITECENIAAVRGWISHEIAGKSYTLAMIQDCVDGGEDGWKKAVDYARRDESFAGEAYLLGQAIASVHAALAEGFGTSEIPAADVRHRLSEHARILSDKHEQLRGITPDFSEADSDRTVTVQRIHGDLHLGQVLRTEDKYVLIDFEGEPTRSLTERKLPDSPLRDIAGMLRSFDYAAHFPAHNGQHGPADPSRWAREAGQALLAGYGVQNSPLLDAYQIDKALYEVDYELGNRPDWVEIPLKAVQTLVK